MSFRIADCLFVTLSQNNAEITLNLIKTTDGSSTFLSEKYGQTYHSVHGAKTESEKVFIELGLEYTAEIFPEINILEMGWGTGLNALLSFERAEEKHWRINYTAIEAEPLEKASYGLLPLELQSWHQLSWGKWHEFGGGNYFRKIETRIEEFHTDEKFNLVYFDAFSPDAQPELWTEIVFGKIYNMMAAGGVLTTYCSKSRVQQNLKSVGFKVEKHPGPPHKREIIRAIKDSND